MRRLGRILQNDGRSVIVALDHGMSLPVLPDLEKTGEKLRAIKAGGADAILTTFGTAARFEEELQGMALILRLDGGGSILGSTPVSRLLYSLEDALKLGADGVALMGFPGAENESETLTNLGLVAARCRDWGVPLMAEMLPGGFTPHPEKTPANVALACRIGAELGASIIKTTYVGPPEEFARVTAGCFVPVVVLGGDHTSNSNGLFGTLEDALFAGAAGVAIGRNVWKDKNPERYTQALVRLVHGREPAQEVCQWQAVV
jgi:fructose-bisphosphate aldolase, class I